ncbi:MAG: hypothetical protein QXR45_13455 [Candidatus Bathyarchaeia archaeon]
MQKIKEIIEDLIEALSIIRACISTFWFWAPVIYFLLSILHIYLMFYVHPLTIFILPIILTFYSVYVKRKKRSSETHQS